jgi:exopolysaccharide biosynthesis polyprenyl glycosylphosphotransferase
VLGTLVARPDLGYRLIGFVDDDAERGTQDVGRVLALGSIDNLAKIVDQQQVDTVIITLPWSSQRRILQIIDTCERKNVNVRVVPDLVQFNMSQIEVEMLNGLPMLGAKGEVSIKRSQLISKRVLDMLITVLALPIILPVMGILALAVRLDSAGPIFFSQIRVGMNGRHFRMIKFRSMIPNAEDLQDHYVQRSSEDPEGKYERKDDDPRITKVGRWLRRTSMDELPQLINVLRGEMSLVGPRPPLPQEVALYQNWQLQRLNAPPGMTGLWQVSGRSNIPFAEKCLLDIYYIENWSLGLDLQILVQTAPQVFIGRGAY